MKCLTFNLDLKDKICNENKARVKYFRVFVYIPIYGLSDFSGNDVLEIRLRALKAIELQFKVYDHLNFNGPFLMKALIRWFDFDQVCEEARVLHLIYDILKVHYQILDAFYVS